MVNGYVMCPGTGGVSCGNFVQGMGRHDFKVLPCPMCKKKKEGMKILVFSFVVGDLFHYGHLRLLKKARALGDIHICGVLTDEAVKTYKRIPICNYKERQNIIKELRCVDETMIQDSRDPTNNLKVIHAKYPSHTIVLVHGDDWEEDSFPGKEYVEKIGGRLVLLPYTLGVSTTSMIEKIRGTKG